MDIEQTLFVTSPVNVYQLPGPRPAAGGWKSGEWRVVDKLFTGRLRVVARGDLAECRFEDTNNGQLFVTCFVRPGQRSAAVEPAADSSRYFVIRVEDPTTGRHAFLGMGFDDRNQAFDFNIALEDHEKQVQRERVAQDLQYGAAAGGVVTPQLASSSAAAAKVAKEVEVLYRPTEDLSLKEGQTIKLNITKKTSPGKTGLMARAAATQSGGAAIRGLAPPPMDAMGKAPALARTITPPPQAPPVDLLNTAGQNCMIHQQSADAQQTAVPSQPLAKPGSGVPSGWATFE